MTELRRVGKPLPMYRLIISPKTVNIDINELIENISIV